MSEFRVERSGQVKGGEDEGTERAVGAIVGEGSGEDEDGGDGDGGGGAGSAVGGVPPGGGSSLSSLSVVGFTVTISGTIWMLSIVSRYIKPMAKIVAARMARAGGMLQQQDK